MKQSPTCREKKKQFHSIVLRHNLNNGGVQEENYSLKDSELCSVNVAADARKTSKLCLPMHLITIITTTFVCMNNGHFVRLYFQGHPGSNTVANQSI